MREYTNSVPQPHSVLSACTCDMCGRPAEVKDGWPKWGAGSVFGVRTRVDIVSLGEDGKVEALWDVCPECLVSRMSRELATPTGDAIAVLSKAMADDPAYARGWHDRIVSAAVASGCDHDAASRAAGLFMDEVFGCSVAMPQHEAQRSTAALRAENDALRAVLDHQRSRYDEVNRECRHLRQMLDDARFGRCDQ